MNENKKISLSFFLLMFVFFVAYKPVDGMKMRYKTTKEKRALFQKLGCVYIEHLLVDMPSIADLKRSCLNEYKVSVKVPNELTYQKEIKHRVQAPLYIAWISDRVGYGLFADRTIESGEYVCEYAGVIRPEKTEHENSDYAWTYTVKQDGKSLLLDARLQGNDARFANHVSRPNCQVVEVFGSDGLYHICYVANKLIKRDEQITVSYGDAYWQTRDIQPEKVLNQ